MSRGQTGQVLVMEGGPSGNRGVWEGPGDRQGWEAGIGVGQALTREAEFVSGEWCLSKGQGGSRERDVVRGCALGLARRGPWTGCRRCGRGAGGRPAMGALGWGGSAGARGVAVRPQLGPGGKPQGRGRHSAGWPGHRLRGSRPWLQGRKGEPQRGLACRGSRASQNACPGPRRLPVRPRT